MKIHSNWKVLALGLQVCGWNHGEWLFSIVAEFGHKDPFLLQLDTLAPKAETFTNYEYWSGKWLLFLKDTTHKVYKDKGHFWDEWALAHKWFTYAPWETEYPAVFYEENDFPLIVWSSNPLTRQGETKIAVVGSREASSYGIFACVSLVKELVTRYNWSIVSGCARGIDMSAHKQALRSNGYTYGFVACGVSLIPSWQKEMFASGCLISIFAPDSRAQKWHFRQRNIYLSRFSHGVLVIEAEVKSGTLLTAHSALEQGRPLAVVTHPIFAPHWQGVRSLIKMGAEIVACAGDCREVFLSERSDVSREQTLQLEVLSQAKSAEESSLLSFILERGGSSLEQDLPALPQQKPVITALVQRGVLIRQAGVVLLSCMIQS